MRVLLADDQPDICSAIRLLFEQEDGIQVVGESAEAEVLLSQARTLCADVVLLDWELPGDAYLEAKAGAGQRVLRELRKECPSLKVVVLSGLPEARGAALAAGADAFVSKGDPPEHLLAVLEAIGKGAPAPAS